MVERFVFGDELHQLAIPKAYIWVLEKDNISAPLRKILIHWDLLNIDTYVLNLSKEPFPKHVSDVEVFKTDMFSLLFDDVNVWKK